MSKLILADARLFLFFYLPFASNKSNFIAILQLALLCGDISVKYIFTAVAVATNLLSFPSFAGVEDVAKTERLLSARPFNSSAYETETTWKSGQCKWGTIAKTGTWKVQTWTRPMNYNVQYYGDGDVTVIFHYTCARVDSRYNACTGGYELSEPEKHQSNVAQAVFAINRDGKLIFKSNSNNGTDGCGNYLLNWLHGLNGLSID